MKYNETLQKEVQETLKFEPMLHVAEIGVTVKDGIVTLTGTVDNYIKKMHALETVKKVRGVLAVADDLEVIIDKSSIISDEMIAENAVRMLRESLIIPEEVVKVTIADGRITLEGIVTWNFQREMAFHLVKDLMGVRGVNNKIKLKKEFYAKVNKEKIVHAFQRHWSLDTDDISIKVSGGTVELSGSVCSLYQKEEAERIAFKTTGVQKVINNLTIEPGLPYLC